MLLILIYQVVLILTVNLDGLMQGLVTTKEVAVNLIVMAIIFFQTQHKKIGMVYIKL